MERPRKKGERDHQLALYTSSSTPNRKIIPAYTTIAHTIDSTSLEVEPLDPAYFLSWVMPWNPGQAKIKGLAADSGYGLCGEARPTPPSTTDAEAIFFFPFTPDSYGVWDLSIYIEAHGFYIMHAHRDWWNCKSALANVEAVVNVFQNYSLGEKHFSMIDINSNNIDVAERYDDSPLFDYQADLGASDLAIVQVRIHIHTFAQGGGSYSEVNFQDGSGNFLQPVVLVASPPS